MWSSGSADSVLDGGRIQLARQRRSMTQKELAKRLGVTPRTVSRYEREDSASRSVSKALSEVLGFPESYFFTPVPDDSGVERVRFRSAVSSSQQSRNAAAASLIHGGAIDDWILDRLTIPSLDLPDLEGATPEEAAHELRYSWALGDGPVPNMIQLLESRGIHVYGLPQISRSVDAFSTWYKQRPLVFLGMQKTPERSRFDAAHELGHLTMHRDGSNLSPSEIEKQADQFASEFLTPKTTIRGAVSFNPGVQELLRFRASFRVSAMAAARAVHAATMSSEWHHRQLMIELSRRGYRTSEPGGMTQYERSRIFDVLFSDDFPKSTTVNTLARETTLPPDDVHALTLGTELRAVPSLEQESASTRMGAQPSEHGPAPTLRLVP